MSERKIYGAGVTGHVHDNDRIPFDDDEDAPIVVHAVEPGVSQRVRLSRWMDRARANATTVTEVPPAVRVDC